MDRQILNFTANEQTLIVENPIRISTNKVNYIEAHFSLGTNWSGYDSVRAVWFNDYQTISTVLDSQGVCRVPFEVMKRKGKVHVNLVGSISENDVLTDRLTSYPVVAVIVDCVAPITGAETSPITPSQFEQFVANVRADADRAEAGAEAAETSASEASASATASAQSATASANSASQAQTYAQNAQNYAVSAETAKADAESARDQILGMRATANTLAEGADATASYSDGVLTLGIPRGATGAKGDKGDTGDTGATPNLSIGTVETLPPTGSSEVTITGTAENPVLNFKLVKGDTGEVTQAEFDEAVTDLKSELNEQKENPLLFSKLRGVEVFGNLWDEDTKAYGYFDTTVTNLGHLIEGGTAWTYSPTYIPVNESDIILYNNSRPIICAYDKDGNVVSCSQPSWSGYTVPSGVAYLRFAVTSASSNGMCIFKDGTSQFEYKSKTKLYLPSLMTEKPIITVDIAGAGDYRSLTEALYDTFEESPDVFVYQGTYDIVAEYKALFGNDIFDNMTYQTEGMKGFQWGLYIDNRTVTFASGAQVVCDMSAYTNDGSRRFSPFNLVRNAVLDGCYCYAVNPYYIVHDDFGTDVDLAFTNIIKNCVLISPEPAQGNVIGGGLKKYATKVVDNCYLDNGNNRPVTMRYHNTNYPNATPTVIIKNTRANGIIRVNCYGTQTTKMIAIINNCKANAIEKAYEGSASVDNIDLYDWCNETNS